MSDAKITVHERQVNSQIIVWTTLIGGFISSLVKWGSEVNMPPRVPGEISPPGANIDAWLGWLGFNSHSLDYVYQGATVPGAVTLLIPLLGFRNPVYAHGATGWLWNLNAAELWSEILGHVYWSVSIEICLIAVLAHFGRPIVGKWFLK